MRHLQRKLLFNIFITSLVLNLVSCSEDPEVPLDQVPVETEIQRFDRAFFESDTTNFETELKRLKADYSPFFSSETEDVFWLNQRKDKLQNELYQLSEEVLGDMEAYQAEANKILKRYYYYFSLQDSLKLYSYISRLDFNFPVIFSPPFIFIANDLYLGEVGQDYYATLPVYLQYERQPQFLLRDLAYALAVSKVQKPQEPASFLSEMLYHGKVLWLTRKLYPALDEANLLKYPPKKLLFAKAHEKEMWVYFIENELLFRSDQAVNRRFLDVAPFSKFRTKIDQETPGRIGRWFGYKIFAAFAEENPKQELSQLLGESDSRKLLKLSGYKP